MTERRNGFVSVSTTGDVLVEIGRERARQKSEGGWSPDHDDEHGTGSLADAAAVYAMSPEGRRQYEGSLDGPKHWPPRFWPFSRGWFKPKDRRRDLIRAAALIVAEIERLDRAALTKAGGE